MESTNRSRAVMVGCVILIGAGCVLAQDWPQWRGPHRDGKVSGFTAPQQWPTELTQKWKTTVGSGDATPALVGNKLYVFTRQGADEVALCLDAGSGKELWRDAYAAQAVTGAPSRHPGPRSTPAVANGKVVTLGVGGVLSCLDAATGKVVWRKDPFPKVVPQFFTAMSPIIIDGMAIAQLGGKGNGAIIAFDLATGDEKWRWSEEGPEYASPVVLTVAGTKQIVTLTEASIVGVGVADGKLLWQLPFAPASRAYNAATPIVDGQTVIYTGAGRGTKAVKIEKQGDGFATKELWSNPDLAPQFNTPVLKDGLLIGLSNRGNLFCINATTGQTAWTDPTQRDRRGFAAVVSTDSCLLALPSNAELIVFKPSDKEYAELARIKVSDTSTHAHPVLAGNRIFIKDQETVRSPRPAHKLVRGC
jgi:outer membrane protein assembly factor BamB